MLVKKLGVILVYRLKLYKLIKTLRYLSDEKVFH
jgi:hypothetical protein